jgi:hypothetical protein
MMIIKYLISYEKHKKNWLLKKLFKIYFSIELSVVSFLSEI